MAVVNYFNLCQKLMTLKLLYLSTKVMSCTKLFSLALSKGSKRIVDRENGMERRINTTLSLPATRVRLAILNINLMLTSH